MIRKLRVKFVCINMLIVLILLSIMLGLVMFSTKMRIEADSIQMMRNIAAVPRMPSRPDEQNEDMNLPFFTLTLDKDGELLSFEGGYYDLSDEESLMTLAEAVQEDGEETGVLSAYHLRYLKRDTREGQTTIVFSDTSSETRVISHLLTNCLLIGFAGLVLFLIVSILLARWAVHPVEQAWEQQRQFVSDASHELKTPLTVILTDTELLQSGTCSETDRSRFLSSIQTMAEQMRGLVEELLSLTRADHTDIKKAQHRMDLSECVSDAVLPFEPVFFENGLTLEENIEDSIRVSGNEDQLHQVVGILLDNAQKYSAPATQTTVSLTRQGKNALLKVSSHGEEISKEDLQNIFRRFYRLDKARSMNHSYGLGLAIAKQIVENHKGKIWAESKDGINTFCIQLPELKS